MDLVDQVPVRLLHVLEADIAKNTGVIDEDINAPKGIDCGLDDVLSILDGIVVGDRITASGLDLLDYFVCGLLLCSACALSSPDVEHVTTKQARFGIKPESSYFDDGLQSTCLIHPY